MNWTSPDGTQLWRWRRSQGTRVPRNTGPVSTVPGHPFQCYSPEVRALSILLALTMWLGPAVQVYASAMSEAHCLSHGHASHTAVSVTSDPAHEGHHAHPGGHEVSGHSHGAGHHCKCGCLCGLACGGQAATTHPYVYVRTAFTEHFPFIKGTVHPHSEPYAPLRPPAVFS